MPILREPEHRNSDDAHISTGCFIGIATIEGESRLYIELEDRHCDLSVIAYLTLRQAIETHVALGHAIGEYIKETGQAIFPTDNSLTNHQQSREVSSAPEATISALLRKIAREGIGSD